MDASRLIPAAQYVRMSTEDQQYSIENQTAAIRKYAESRGFLVVSTYSDAGKSGLAIKYRHELQRLIRDVTSGDVQYKAILVYDVSRWGRFQDVDEAAHYEFLCKSAGIPVRYCAEEFDNDGSLPSSIMKSLKRTMAAEYSRELGVKVSAGQRRLSLLGFRVVGIAGYGLRRMTISPDGRRRVLLGDGEQKAIKTHRTILVPGPKREVQCVRRIFELAALRKTPHQIANQLNAERVPFSNGRRWHYAQVRRILKNDKYIGCNTYGKTTRALCSPSRGIERRLWVTNPHAFDPIVRADIFNLVQKLIEKRATRKKISNACLIQAMKRVLNREGRITERLLKKKRGLFDHRTYYKRFGSVMRAYELAGYVPPPLTTKIVKSQEQVRRLRVELYRRLKELFSDRIRFISLVGQKVQNVVEIDSCVRVSIYLCRSAGKTDSGERGWVLRVRAQEKELPVLICTINPSFSELLEFYVVAPLVGWPCQERVFRENQTWLSAGRLKQLDDFCTVAKTFAFPGEAAERRTTVDDILLAADTWTVTLDGKEITLGRNVWTILHMLVLQAGHVVSLEQLSKHLRDPTSLSVYIHNLRVKLGEQAQKRIQSTSGVGYAYVPPGKWGGLRKDAFDPVGSGEF